MPLTVTKRNRRLVIADAAGGIVYCPPDFLRPAAGRAALQAVADAGATIGAIVVYEAAHSPRNKEPA